MGRGGGSGKGAGGRGYNPNRDRRGQFASGPRKIESAASRATSTKAKAGKSEDKLRAAREASRTSVLAARSALVDARKAAAAARKDPTSSNVNAARTATTKASRAAAKAEKHRADLARREQSHAKAQTRAALAEAKLKEANRARPAPIPRAQKVEARESPSFHFGPGQRIRGEATEPAKAIPRKETVLEMLSRTRPRYVHVPTSPKAQDLSAAGLASRQARERELRARFEANRPKRPAAEPLPKAAQVVSLPRATVVKPRPSLLQRLFGRRRDSRDWQPARVALARAKRAAGHAREHPGKVSRLAAKLAIELATEAAGV